MNESARELSDVLNYLKGQIDDLKAENLVLKILVPYSIGLLVQKANDPQKYFSEIRDNSLRNITERTKFTSGDAEGNRQLLAKAAAIHEQVFEELRRTLGQRHEQSH